MTDTAAPDAHLVVDPVERALEELAAGRPVVVLDAADRENEGDLIMAAEHMTEAWMAFFVRHGSGYVCVPMSEQRADALSLPLMVPRNEESMGTAFTVTVDARDGVSTGISAADRALTVRLLAGHGTGPQHLVRPGHVAPLRARDGGVLVRPGHTEAAVDLCRLAGLTPVGAIVELVRDDGEMLRGEACRRFADEHRLALVTIEALREHLSRPVVRQVASTRLPTDHAVFTAHAYVDRSGTEHVALTLGDLSVNERAENAEPVLVRLHSECLTGDVLGSLRCDCGPQLRLAMQLIADVGRGAVVYLRGHEGRGIGVAAKLAAYARQDEGRDTVDANLDLGLPVDARQYGAAAAILADLGVHDVRLMTNNPEKVTQLEAAGVRISERVGVLPPPHPENLRYLRTKAERMGHHLPHVDLTHNDHLTPTDHLHKEHREPHRIA
ncbi:MAG TPA: 3,4-dihydroxy-2-butanone-4-phosphate synthase [Actinomycetales bacterium]|nr:3,4-dihydroxy-2-butanone-4-phosphate synthase [Actinomycetales bacterium]